MKEWPKGDDRYAMPGRMVDDLASVKFGPYKRHEAVEQAMFRSLEELAYHYPDSIDLSGERFGKLWVMGYSHLVAHVDKNTQATTHFDQWSVRCDCGSEAKTVGGNHLRTGNTRSCGCARGRYGKRTENYHDQFPDRFQRWKNPQRFQVSRNG